MVMPRRATTAHRRTRTLAIVRKDPDITNRALAVRLGCSIELARNARRVAVEAIEAEGEA